MKKLDKRLLFYLIKLVPFYLFLGMCLPQCNCDEPEPAPAQGDFPKPNFKLSTAHNIILNPNDSVEVSGDLERKKQYGKTAAGIFELQLDSRHFLVQINMKNDAPFNIPGVEIFPSVDTLRVEGNNPINKVIFWVIASSAPQFGDFEVSLVIRKLKDNKVLIRENMTIRVVPIGSEEPLSIIIIPDSLRLRNSENGSATVIINRDTNLIQNPVSLTQTDFEGFGFTTNFMENPTTSNSTMFISVGQLTPIRSFPLIVRAEADGFFATANFTLDVISDWYYQTIISQPAPGTRFFYDVAFRNDRGMISGFGGEIFYTVDDGSSWHKSETGTTAHLFGVAAVEQDIFVACGNLKTILRTTNTGGSWTAIQNIPGPDNSSLFGIAFEPNQRLIGAVVSSTDVLWTTDAGYNWTIRNNFQNQYLLNGGIDFWDENNALITGQFTGGGSPVILRTTNQGQTWNATQVPSIVRSVSCFGSNLALAVGSDNAILRTTNKGISWDVIYYNKPATAFTSVSFANENVGTIVGTYKPGSYLQPLVLRTTNGGVNWFEELVFVPQVTDVHFRRVIMTTPEKAFAVGSNYIYRRDP